MKLSKQLPLNALRVFEAVGRLMSFTRAGEELGMTQTAVSYQIKLLEEHVGEPLFLRKPRRIELTETGRRLAPKVGEAFGLLSEAIADSRQQAVAANGGDAGSSPAASTHLCPVRSRSMPTVHWIWKEAPPLPVTGWRC